MGGMNSSSTIESLSIMLIIGIAGGTALGFVSANLVSGLADSLAGSVTRSGRAVSQYGQRKSSRDGQEP